MRRFLFETIHDVALMIDRERVGRELEARLIGVASSTLIALARAVGSCGLKCRGRGDLVHHLLHLLHICRSAGQAA